MFRENTQKRIDGAIKMGKNDNYEIDGGWVATAVMLALVFPIGLIMLWKKVTQIKKGKNLAKQLTKIGASLVAAGIGLAALGITFAGGVFEALVGGIILWLSKDASKKENRRKRYMAIIGKNAYMPIVDIARAIPVSVEQAKNELQEMIEQGYFGANAYIDLMTMCIVLDGSAPYSTAYRQQPIYAEPEPEPVYEEPVKEEKPVQEEETEEQDQYAQWIRSIREVNDRIDDPVISEKIDRIELLTKKIFEMVKKRPDKEGQIRKFMNYYLPTTLKLLDSYALLEDQGIEGENITASKHQIEGIMDTLIQGFEKQLDLLFSAQAMDINSDIEVLESMMAVDGLKENQFRMKKSAGSK